MTRLFAHSHLQNMFKNIGWEGFLSKSARSYHTLTLEFLRTYAYDVDQRLLTFQLLEHNYELTFNQVNEAMGVDLNRGPLADRFSLAFFEFKKDARTQFYRLISRDSEEFDSYKRDYWIVHPNWILAHRVLSTSITSRREAGQLNSNELFILYCIYKEIPVDFRDFFLEKCDLIRSRFPGDIGIGGLVTLLAQAVDLNFEDVRENATGREDDIFLTFNVLQSMQLVNYNQKRRIDWFTADETDRKIKHPCFELTQKFMDKFKLQRKSTWKPKFHYTFPSFQPKRVQERGQSSRGGRSIESDEEMEEIEEEESEESEEEESEEEQEEEEMERDEDDNYPLSVYQQLGRLNISNQNMLRNQDQMFTSLQNVTNQLQNVANTQAAMQHNMQFMQQQQHDMWSFLRPEGGYPSYPQYQPPPGAYYPYPPPPGGYPPYYQPPPGGPSQ